MVKYLTVYQMSTVRFCYASPTCSYSEMANTCDFLSQGQGSTPCASTKVFEDSKVAITPEMVLKEMQGCRPAKYFILENGVIGNTRAFEVLIISSSLVSPARGN